MNHQNQIDLQQRDHFVQQRTTAVLFVPRAAVHDDAAVKRLLVVLYPRLHVVGEGVKTTLESTSQRRNGDTGPDCPCSTGNHKTGHMEMEGTFGLSRVKAVGRNNRSEETVLVHHQRTHASRNRDVRTRDVEVHVDRRLVETDLYSRKRSISTA